MLYNFETGATFLGLPVAALKHHYYQSEYKPLTLGALGKPSKGGQRAGAIYFDAAGLRWYGRIRSQLTGGRHAAGHYAKVLKDNPPPPPPVDIFGGVT